MNEIERNWWIIHYKNNLKDVPEYMRQSGYPESDIAQWIEAHKKAIRELEDNA